MKPDVERYFSEQYSKQKFRIVPGHHPDFESKEHVNKWIEFMSGLMDYSLQKFSNTEENMSQQILQPTLLLDSVEAETADTTELIIIKQLPEFEQSFIKANATITTRLAALKDLDISEESKNQAKKIRAELNKEFSLFEERRKVVKKEINEPYAELEKLYNGYISEPYNNAISELDGKIKDIEKKQLEAKREVALEYFKEYRDSLGEDLAFLCYERLGIDINLSVTEKKLKEQIREKCDKIKSDIESLKTMGGYSERYIICYRNLLEVSAAISTVNKAVEQEQLLKAEASAPVDDETHTTGGAVEPVEPEVTPAVEVGADEPKESADMLVIHLTVRGTRKQLANLKEYIVNSRLEVVKK